MHRKAWRRAIIVGLAAWTAACAESELGQGEADLGGTCTNGVRDSGETDVDCGGGACQPCGEGQVCRLARDCVEASCGRGTCLAAACDDGHRNGDEVDVDCGGGCAPCATALPECPTPPLCVGPPLDVTAGERRGRLAYPVRGPLAQLVTDRDIYEADDTLATLAIAFLIRGPDNTPAAGEHMRIELYRPGEAATPIAVRDLAAPLISLKQSARIDLRQLTPGSYVVRATLLGGDDDPVVPAMTHEFDKRPATVATRFPDDGVPIELAPLEAGASGISARPIATGLPLPRGALVDVARLALYEEGVRVPAQFTVRERWGAGGAIKWAGLDFVGRWDGATPRRYRVVRMAATTSPATTLTVTPYPDRFEIVTAKATYTIPRLAFVGISDARWRQGSTLRPALGAGGGPYFTDEQGTLFTACAGVADDVAVEEQGPIKVTIVARRPYCAASGERRNRFVSRITIYADGALATPLVHVKHRTIIEHDQSHQIADLAWSVPTRVKLQGADPVRWRLGIDGAVREGLGPQPDQTAFVRQATSTRAEPGGLAGTTAGQIVDGWAQLVGPLVAVQVAIPDARERFPKELELHAVTTDPTRPATTALTAAVVHLWPKHGEVEFTADEIRDRAQVHKLRWAHHGPRLSLAMPPDVQACLQQFDAGTPAPSCGAAVANASDMRWDEGGEVANGAIATSQGLAITGEFELRMHAATEASAVAASWSRRFRAAPHALARPSWTATTGVEEMMSAADPARYPDAEYLLGRAWPRYHESIQRAGDEYGMWIYGNLHNSWDASRGVPMLHRVWMNSHYRSVHASWLSYLRTGDPATLTWARAHAASLSDVGIVHSDRDGWNDPLTNRHHQGIKGSYNHCTGFMPWGNRAESLTAGHWIDVAGPVLGYYVTGDRFLLDDVREWGEGLARTGVADATGPPATSAGADIRNDTTTLGELTRYYQATRDPQALLHMERLALVALGTPWETMPGANPMFEPSWFVRYYDQSRDGRVKDRLFASIHHDPTRWADDPNLTAYAFLWRETGDLDYLAPKIPKFWDDARVVFRTLDSDRAVERYHDYGRWSVSSQRVWLSEASAFLWAMARSGLDLPAGTRAQYYPYAVSAGSSNAPFAVWGSSGWSNARLIALAMPSVGRDLDLDLRHVESVLDPQASRTFGAWSGPARQPIDTVPPAPTYRLTPWLGADAGAACSQGGAADQRCWPIARGLVTTPGVLSRVECSIETYCALRDPAVIVSGHPEERAPQAVVLRRVTMFPCGTSLPCPGPYPVPAVYRAVWRSDWYLRPVATTGAITIRIAADTGKDGGHPPSATPAWVRLEDRNGQPLFDTSLFAYATLPAYRERVLTLDASTAPWRLRASSEYGPTLQLVSGAEELLLARHADELAPIAAALAP